MTTEFETSSPSHNTLARVAAAVREIQAARELKARTAGLTESITRRERKSYGYGHEMPDSRFRVAR